MLDRLWVMHKKVLDGASKGREMEPYLTQSYEWSLKNPLLKPYASRCNCCQPGSTGLAVV